MKTSELEQIDDLFQRIPLLTEFQPKDFQITKLDSYSNQNYRLKNQNMDFILRIPRAETNIYIDRAAETVNEQIAYRLGLSAKVLWSNKNGESLTQTIRHSTALVPLDLTNTNIMIVVIERLKQLHTSQQHFQGQVNLQNLLNRYFNLLNRGKQDRYRQRFEEAGIILQTLEGVDQAPVPSHNDLNENNLLLDKNNKLWLIDWEYSSMASPYWDLATICNAGEYQKTHCTRLLGFYNNEDNHLELHKLQDYRAILSLLSECWISVFEHPD